MDRFIQGHELRKPGNSRKGFVNKFPELTGGAHFPEFVFPRFQTTWPNLLLIKSLGHPRIFFPTFKIFGTGGCNQVRQDSINRGIVIHTGYNL